MTCASPVLPYLPQTITIARHTVGPGHPCFIIAEAGSNHDKKLDQALALVDAAAEAGADAVKFQTFSGPDIASAYDSPETRLPEVYRQWGKNLQEFYAHCALPDHFHEPLAERAANRGILFLSSPFSEQAADRLARLGVPAFKIASFELGHLPLIRHCASIGLPLILSTGMAGLGDVERALDAAAAGGAKEVVLLHCGSSYPLGPAGANLAVMETMRRAFSVPVGYSDHTRGIAVPITAAALGANVLEKHFTVSCELEGADHSFALEPDLLKAMVEGMRTAESAVGGPVKRRQPEEEEHVRRGRRSLFAARAIAAGAMITPDDLKVVRPGTGLEPVLLDLILGRRTVRDVAADTPLSWDDFLTGTP